MSTKPELHYWASGMPRAQAQLYLLDLCGSDSNEYTERAEEVTCERCLAALRADSGPASLEAPAGAPGPLGSSGPVIFVAGPSVDEQVHAAVLKVAQEVHAQCIVAANSRDSEAANAVECNVSIQDITDEVLAALLLARGTP